MSDPPVLLLTSPRSDSTRNRRATSVSGCARCNTQGRTILLTTHYMEEADQLCDRIGIIDLGRIMALDTPAALKRTIAATEVVRLEVQGAVASDPGPRRSAGEKAGSIARQERQNGVLSPHHPPAAAPVTSSPPHSTRHAPRAPPSTTSRWWP